MAKTALKNVETINEELSTDSAATATAKRQSKASVSYLMPDGSEKNFPTVGATAIRFEVSDGTKRDFDLTKTLDEKVRECAVQQGLVTRIQRGFQAVKTADEVIASIDDSFEALYEGTWLEVGTGEPKITQLVTAIVMALESNGETVDAARRKAIIDKLAASEDMRKEVRSRPAIAANLATLAREAAEKREQEKLAAAQGSVAEDVSGF